MYGGDAGARFRDLWDLHITLLLAYADAARAGNSGRMEAARDGLGRYMSDLGELLAELNPALDADVEAEALQAHIDQITAFADGDYADAYAAYRVAFSHMFHLGDHLALEIVRQFPARFSAGPDAFSPRSDLRLALDRLLGEHLVLAAEAMRAGVRQSPAFEAARESLDANSGDLAAGSPTSMAPIQDNSSRTSGRNMSMPTWHSSRRLVRTTTPNARRASADSMPTTTRSRNS